MIIWEKKMVEESEIKDILCNKCGKSCKGEYDFENLEANSSWGYGSNRDGEVWQFHLCEKCSVKLYNTFKVKEGIIVREV